MAEEEELASFLENVISPQVVDTKYSILPTVTNGLCNDIPTSPYGLRLLYRSFGQWQRTGNPFVVFDRKNKSEGEVPGTVYELSSSGWMDSTEWFLFYAPASRPLLLLLDGHRSHYYPRVHSPGCF